MSTPSFAPQDRRLRVFLCHSSSDKQSVRHLYRRLQADGFLPWLDEVDLIPGQEWQEEIPVAVRASDVVIVCLSRDSVGKEGYLQREIREALYIAEEKPEGTVFIIPVKIEEVEVPNRLRKWQWANLFDEEGYQRLLQALDRRAKTAGLSARVPTKNDGRERVWATLATPIELGDSRASSPLVRIKDDASAARWRRTKYWAAGVAVALIVAGLSLEIWLGHKRQSNPQRPQVQTSPSNTPSTNTALLPSSKDRGVDSRQVNSPGKVRAEYPLVAKLVADLNGHTLSVNSAAFSLDGGRVVTASADKTARVWNAHTGQLLAILRGHTGEVKSAEFSINGQRIVTASDDKTARMWDAVSGSELAVLYHNDVVSSAVFSPDGQRIVTASHDRTARVWNIKSGQLLNTLQGHNKEVYSAVFSPDSSRVVTASGDGTARIWDASTGQCLAILRGHGDEVWNAAFSADGQQIVTASKDKTAKVWEVANGHLVTTMTGSTEAIRTAEFSPDGQRVVIAGYDRTALVFDATTGTVLASLPTDHYAWSAVFSPHGERIATASGERSARVWNTFNGHELALIPWHDGAVNSVAFSPDGQRLVTASSRQARVWKLYQAEH